MRNRSLPVCSFVFLCFAFAALVPSLAAQSTSTPQERAHWAQVTHQLETNPLDPALNKDGDEAVHRLIEVHDFHVTLCGFFFKGSPKKYKYLHEVVRQFMLATAAFQIENPTASVDADNVAGVESALKVYQVILQKDPRAKSKWLEKLLKEQREGKLEREIKKAC